MRSDRIFTRTFCLPSAMCGPFCSVPPVGRMIVVLPPRIASRTSVQVSSSRNTVSGGWAEAPGEDTTRVVNTSGTSVQRIKSIINRIRFAFGMFPAHFQGGVPPLTGRRRGPSVPSVEVTTGRVMNPTAVGPHRLRWSRQLRRVTHSGMVLAGTLCVAVIVVVAVFAGSLAPQAPDDQNFDLIEAPPGLKAFFGTDRFGRDVLSRVIYGTRISLYVAVTSLSVAMAAGGALGLTAGYLGGAWDNVINRVLDVFFSIPGLLLSIGVAAMRGPGVNSAVIAI